MGLKIEFFPGVLAFSFVASSKPIIKVIALTMALFGEWIFVVEGRDEEVCPKLGLVQRYLFRLIDATRLV